MYGILDLDPALWTARTDVEGVVLEHPLNPRLSVSDYSGGWRIQVRTPRSSGFSLLVCQAHRDLVLGPDLVPSILEHIAAVAGPHVPQRLLDMHRAVRTAIIRSGHVGEVVLNRTQGDEPTWIFYTPDGDYLGISHGMLEGTPLGHYQRVVNRLAVGIRGVAAPNRYTGDPEEVLTSRYWTYQGVMSWDVTYTQHERMELLAAQDSTPP